MKGKLTALAALLLVCLAALAAAETARVTAGNLEKTIYGSGVIEPLSQPGV